jgi:hypothetical protein
VLTQVIAQPSRPQPVRLSALDVLASYYELGATLRPDAEGATADPAQCVFGGVSHVVVAEVAQPVSLADRPAILAAVQAVAAGDGDAAIRRAAACAAAAMKRT